MTGAAFLKKAARTVLLAQTLAFCISAALMQGSDSLCLKSGLISRADAAPPPSGGYSYPDAPVSSLSLDENGSGSYVPDANGFLEHGFIGLASSDNHRFKMKVRGTKLSESFSASITQLGSLMWGLKTDQSWARQDKSAGSGATTSALGAYFKWYNSFSSGGGTYWSSFERSADIGTVGVDGNETPRIGDSNSSGGIREPKYSYQRTLNYYTQPTVQLNRNGSYFASVAVSDTSKKQSFTKKAENIEYNGFGWHFHEGMSWGAAGHHDRAYGVWSTIATSYEDLRTHVHNNELLYWMSQQKSQPNCLSAVLNGHPIPPSSGYNAPLSSSIYPDPPPSDASPPYPSSQSNTNNPIGVWQWDLADKTAYEQLRIDTPCFYEIETAEPLLDMSSIRSSQAAAARFGAYTLSVDGDPSPDKTFYVSLIAQPEQPLVMQLAKPFVSGNIASFPNASTPDSEKVYIDVYPAGNEDIIIKFAGNRSSSAKLDRDKDGNALPADEVLNLSLRDDGFFTAGASGNYNDPSLTMGNLELCIDGKNAAKAQEQTIVVPKNSQAPFRIPVSIKNGNAITKDLQGEIRVEISWYSENNPQSIRSGEIVIPLLSRTPNCQIEVPSAIVMLVAKDGSTKFTDFNTDASPEGANTIANNFIITNCSGYDDIPVSVRVSPLIEREANMPSFSPYSVSLITLPSSGNGLTVPFAVRSFGTTPPDSDYTHIGVLPAPDAAYPDINKLHFKISGAGTLPPPQEGFDGIYRFRLNYKFAPYCMS